MARTDSEDLEAFVAGLDPATLRIVLIELAHVVEAFGEEGPSRDLAIVQAVTRVNVEQASKWVTRKPTRLVTFEALKITDLAP